MIYLCYSSKYLICSEFIRFHNWAIRLVQLWVSTWRFIGFFFLLFSGARQRPQSITLFGNRFKYTYIVMDWRRPSTSSCTLMISFRKCRFHFGSRSLSLSLSLWCALFNCQHSNDWYFFSGWFVSTITRGTFWLMWSFLFCSLLGRSVVVGWLATRNFIEYTIDFSRRRRRHHHHTHHVHSFQTTTHIHRKRLQSNAYKRILAFFSMISNVIRGVSFSCYCLSLHANSSQWKNLFVFLHTYFGNNF